jgi:hypothetical protein
MVAIARGAIALLVLALLVANARAEPAAAAAPTSPPTGRFAIAAFAGGPLYALGAEVEATVHPHLAIAVALAGAGALDESGIVVMPRLHGATGLVRGHVGAGVAATRYARPSCTLAESCGGWTSLAATEAGLQLGGDHAFVGSAIGFRQTVACTMDCGAIDKPSVYLTGAAGVRF